MSETKNHPWCRDVRRDEAVRAAEDAAAAERTPLPDHRDLPAAVAELRERVARLEDHFADASKMVTPKPAPPPADGLRTERVTLELTGRFDTPPSDWPWEAIFAHDVRVHLEPGDSVRVVEESETSDGCHRWDRDGERCVKCNDKDWMGGPCNTTDEEYIARLTAHRDAAIRERDAAREEAARLRHLLKTKESECETHHPWVHPSAAPAANAGGVARQEPVAWGVMNGDGSVYEAFADHEVQKQQAIELAQQSQKLFGLSELPLSPLYAAPQPPRGWLTEEMRDDLDEALEWLNCQTNVFAKRAAAAIATTLARETPPKVKVPRGNSDLRTVRRDNDWIAAIREAGVEVQDG